MKTRSMLSLNAISPGSMGRACEVPRTAGVSAFGFGGTNVHVVLEEYSGDYLCRTQPAMKTWPVELFVWRHKTKDDLLAAAEHAAKALSSGADPAPR